VADDCAAATENLLLAAANLGLERSGAGSRSPMPRPSAKSWGSGKAGSPLHHRRRLPAESPSPHTKYRKEKVHWTGLEKVTAFGISADGKLYRKVEFFDLVVQNCY